MPLLALAVAGCTTNAPAEPELPAKTIATPPDWQGVIGASALYEIGLDHLERHGGRAAAYMSGPPMFTSEVAFLTQLLRADNYRGKRLRLSAWVKGRGLIGPIAGLWMRVDGAGVVFAYDNMGNRTETGTSEWHQVSVVLDVPNDTLGIVIGAMRQGGGTLFIDDMKLETVGSDVPSTNMFDAPKPNSIDPAKTSAGYLNALTSPTNMTFERMP
ncbi:MAG TPA: hypothetical protein VIP11_18335 [Gemmatimonadaceae bacterium]